MQRAEKIQYKCPTEKKTRDNDATLEPTLHLFTTEEFSRPKAAEKTEQQSGRIMLHIFNTSNQLKEK